MMNMLSWFTWWITVMMQNESLHKSSHQGFPSHTCLVPTLQHISDNPPRSPFFPAHTCSVPTRPLWVACSAPQAMGQVSVACADLSLDGLCGNIHVYHDYVIVVLACSTPSPYYTRNTQGKIQIVLKLKLLNFKPLEHVEVCLAWSGNA